MSLTGALNLGKTALAVQQAALQVTGNNIANAGNPDYSREVADTSNSPDQMLRPGVFVGTGVNLDGISRQVDDALAVRLRASISDNEAAKTQADWGGRVQSLLDPLGDSNLSTGMSNFFASWSSLANKPQDPGLRQIVFQQGDTLAKQFNSLSGSLSGLQSDVSTQLSGLVDSANTLAQQVADLNKQITLSEGGAPGENNGLRDQRDAVLKQLSQLTNVQTADAGNGMVNVYVNSMPLVEGTNNRGLQLTQTVTPPPAGGATNVTGTPTYSVVFKADGATANVTSGQIGALLGVQQQLQTTGGQLDSIANNLIYSLNKLHSSGQGTVGYDSVTGTSQVLDPTAPLDSAAAGLHFAPTNGSFVVHVKDATTGLSTSTLVQVNLTGSASDTTLNSLTTSLNGIANVSATIVGGQLRIKSTNPNQQISFSQDSSGALASLGINTFYQGYDASTIAVNPTIGNKLAYLAAGKNGDAGDNQTALAIASLETASQPGLNGASIRGTYRNMVNAIGSAAAAAKTDSEATQTVRDTLEAQRESLSGVSMNEEAINLVKQQQAFQGAARFVSTINDLMKTLLAMQ